MKFAVRVFYVAMVIAALSPMSVAIDNASYQAGEPEPGESLVPEQVTGSNHGFAFPSDEMNSELLAPQKNAEVDSDEPVGAGSIATDFFGNPIAHGSAVVDEYGKPIFGFDDKGESFGEEEETSPTEDLLDTQSDHSSPKFASPDTTSKEPGDNLDQNENNLDIMDHPISQITEPSLQPDADIPQTFVETDFFGNPIAHGSAVVDERGNPIFNHGETVHGEQYTEPPTADLPDSHSSHEAASQEPEDSHKYADLPQAFVETDFFGNPIAHGSAVVDEYGNPIFNHDDDDDDEPVRDEIENEVYKPPRNWYDDQSEIGSSIFSAPSIVDVDGNPIILESDWMDDKEFDGNDKADSDVGQAQPELNVSDDGEDKADSAAEQQSETAEEFSPHDNLAAETDFFGRPLTHGSTVIDEYGRPVHLNDASDEEKSEQPKLMEPIIEEEEEAGSNQTSHASSGPDEIDPAQDDTQEKNNDDDIEVPLSSDSSEISDENSKLSLYKTEVDTQDSSSPVPPSPEPSDEPASPVPSRFQEENDPEDKIADNFEIMTSISEEPVENSGQEQIENTLDALLTGANERQPESATPPTTQPSFLERKDDPNFGVDMPIEDLLEAFENPVTVPFELRGIETDFFGRPLNPSERSAVDEYGNIVEPREISSSELDKIKFGGDDTETEIDDSQPPQNSLPRIHVVEPTPVKPKSSKPNRRFARRLRACFHCDHKSVKHS